jgi:5-methylcytosine-specific restriction enzyme subunit McrC
MLLYAWDALEEQHLVDLEAEGFTSLADMFASVLANGTVQLIKRGLDRGYRTHQADVVGVRGKLLIDETVKRALRSRAAVHCAFDELTPDVLHNSIVRSTLASLYSVHGLDPDLRGRLATLQQRLEGVPYVTLSPRVFNMVQVHRNNAFYRFLLGVCRIVYDSVIPEEVSGRVRFRNFLRDRRRMALLFQRFVRNFYHHEQERYAVSSPRIEWFGTDGTAEDLALLPSMATDIVLRSEQAAQLIDTKYYFQAFQHYRGRKRVRSSHLYQMMSYLTNLRPNFPATLELRGMLLYPAVSEHFNIRLRVQGYPVVVRSINLNQPWAGLRNDMLELLAT